MQPRPAPRWLSAPAIMVLIAASLALGSLLLLGRPSVAADGVTWRAYDDGVRLQSVDPVSAHPFSLSIEYFTDAPAASWSRASIPVEICTQQLNRPAGLTAEGFRDAVASATSMWNRAGAAVGFDYLGDCESGIRWQPENGRTEIGFDDFRNVVQGQSAAVATGTWTTIFGSKEFVEFDVVLDERLSVPRQCLESVIAHEFGHVLGLGHSDDTRDLMYPSFSPNDLATCPVEARSPEVAALRSLYGENAPPTVVQPAAVVVAAGTLATVSVKAEDPEGDELTYEWQQLSGDALTFEASGPALTLDAPDAEGGEFLFRVTVFDSYLHPTSVELLVRIDASQSPPTRLPSLTAIRAAADGSDAIFEWSLPDDATSLELCSTGAEEVCESSTTGEQAISWESTLTQAGSATARRIFTSGARPTSASACNAAGCGPAGEGPLAGGLNWVPWGIDFDYVAMAMDFPGFRLTVAAVVNLGDGPRAFTLYTGSATQPLQNRIMRCGTLNPGQSCFAVLGPNDSGHGEIVTVVSSATGTPTTEHRVEVR